MTAKLLQATAVALALSLCAAPAALAQSGGGGSSGGGTGGGSSSSGGSVGSRGGGAPGLQGSGRTVGRSSRAIQPNVEPGSGLTGGTNGLTSSDTAGSGAAGSGTGGLGAGAATLPRDVLNGGISASGLGGPTAGSSLGGTASGGAAAGAPAPGAAAPLPTDRGAAAGAGTTDQSGLGRMPATDTSRVDRGAVGVTGSGSPERNVLNGGVVGNSAESAARGTPLGTGGAAARAPGATGTSTGGTLGRTTLRSGSSTNPNDGTSDPVPPSGGGAGSSLVPPRDRAAPPTQSPLDCGGSFGRCGSPSRRDAASGAGSATMPRP